MTIFKRKPQIASRNGRQRRWIRASVGLAAVVVGVGFYRWYTGARATQQLIKLVNSQYWKIDSQTEVSMSELHYIPSIYVFFVGPDDGGAFEQQAARLLDGGADPHSPEARIAVMNAVHRGNVDTLRADSSGAVLRMDDLTGRNCVIYHGPPAGIGQPFSPEYVDVDSHNRIYIGYASTLLRMDDMTGRGLVCRDCSEGDPNWQISGMVVSDSRSH